MYTAGALTIVTGQVFVNINNIDIVKISLTCNYPGATELIPNSNPINGGIFGQIIYKD